MFIATQSSNVSSDHQVVCGQCKLGLRGLESWQPQPMDPEVLAKAQVMAAKVTGALIPKTCCDASVEVFACHSNVLQAIFCKFCKSSRL